MTEQYPSDAELNGLSGTTDNEQEVLFITTGEAPYYTSFYKTLYRLLKVARRAGDLRVFKDGDLTFGVRAGRYFNGDTAVNYSQVTGQALTNNATNYIYLTASGTLTVNTTGFPTPSVTPHIPLATILTAAGDYDGRDLSEGGDITDYRGRTIFGVCRAPGLENTIADPGDAGAIPVTDTGHCDIVTAGAETRTIAAPDKLGSEMLISLKTDGGNCTITVATLINQTGNNTITMDDEGDSILLVAIAAGANKRWRVVYNDGCTLSTV